MTRENRKTEAEKIGRKRAARVENGGIIIREPADQKESGYTRQEERGKKKSRRWRRRKEHGIMRPQLAVGGSLEMACP